MLKASVRRPTRPVPDTDTRATISVGPAGTHAAAAAVPAPLPLPRYARALAPPPPQLSLRSRCQARLAMTRQRLQAPKTLSDFFFLSFSLLFSSFSVFWFLCLPFFISRMPPFLRLTTRHFFGIYSSSLFITVAVLVTQLLGAILDH